MWLSRKPLSDYMHNTSNTIFYFIFLKHGRSLYFGLKVTYPRVILLSFASVGTVACANVRHSVHFVVHFFAANVFSSVLFTAVIQKVLALVVAVVP